MPNAPKKMAISKVIAGTKFNKFSLFEERTIIISAILPTKAKDVPTAETVIKT